MSIIGEQIKAIKLRAISGKAINRTGKVVIVVLVLFDIGLFLYIRSLEIYNLTLYDCIAFQ